MTEIRSPWESHPAAPLLHATLQVAVPMTMWKLQEGNRDDWWESLERGREEWLDLICSKGDNLLYKSKKKGLTAQVFNALAKVVAHLAFVPGGVTFMGDHYEGSFREDQEEIGSQVEAGKDVPVENAPSSDLADVLKSLNREGKMMRMGGLLGGEKKNPLP